MPPKSTGKEAFSYVARILLYLYERELKNLPPPSLSQVIEEAGIPRATFYNHLKDNLANDGYVKYEQTPDRIILVQLTEKGRRLAECLWQCREVLPL